MQANTIKLAIAAAALAIAPTAAFAGDADVVERTTKVEYNDLDLTTEAGVAELDSRIESAARAVCNINQHQVGTRVRSRDARECFTAAKSQLDRQFAAIKRNALLGG